MDDALDRNDPLATNLLAAAPASRTTEIVARLTERLLGATWLRRQQTLEAKQNGSSIESLTRGATRRPSF
jgi:hypothetical protein